MSARDSAAFNMHQGIVSSLHEHHGNRTRGVTDGLKRFWHRSGDGGDSGNAIRNIAGEPLREEPTVGNSSGVDPVSIEGIGARNIRDQSAHKADIISGRKIASVVPMSIYALGIGDDKTMGLGKLIKAGESRHV